MREPELFIDYKVGDWIKTLNGVGRITKHERVGYDTVKYPYFDHAVVAKENIISRCSKEEYPELFI